MRRWKFSLIVTLGMISFSAVAEAQWTNTFPWPQFPPVGIGTTTPSKALEIHYDPNNPTNRLPAIIRLSSGYDTTTDTFAIFGLMPQLNTTYTSLATGQDLILHEHKQGDIIITNCWEAKPAAAQMGGSIRLATGGDTSILPFPIPTAHDMERMTILPNGNVGIDLPPDSATGLGLPMDQLQLGGGVKLPPFLVDPHPGLTFYGGNRFEGMPINGDITHTFPVDWRGISFNQYHNQWGAAGNGSRFSHMSSSGIRFAEGEGGMLQLGCWPYDSTRGKDDFRRGMTLSMTGSQGLSLWSDERDSDQYHHLFDVYRPQHIEWPFSRNPYGMFIHRTPVYIDTGGNVDFSNLPVRPNLGDDTTWLLAVNGPALFKEAWVNTDWPDFVFDSSYKLPSLGEVEQFIKANSHLQGVPSVREVAKTGVALGETSAKLLQKIEELTLYTIELKKDMEALKAQVQDLKNGGK